MSARAILVTGTSGCIGRALVPMLVAGGWAVHGVTRRPAADLDPTVTWHRDDLLESGVPARLIGSIQPEALVHLAWYIAPGRWAEAPDNVEWVRASLELAQAFVRSGGRRFVGGGSCLEYDWSYGYCSEDLTPCAPHTLYGRSKHALRLLLEGLTAQAGVSFAWGRAFFLHGAYEHPDRLVPAVMRALLKGEPARVSHGRQVRDYLHVDDVASAFAALVESDQQGVFNVCSGQAVTLRAIVEAIGGLAGTGSRIEFGAIPAAATDRPLVVGNPSRLVDAVGWAPQLTMEQGLARSWAWWRQVEADKVQRA